MTDPDGAFEVETQHVTMQFGAFSARDDCAIHVKRGGFHALLGEHGIIPVLMITHKFREVTAFADEVSVLKRGKLVRSGQIKTASRNSPVQSLSEDNEGRAALARGPSGEIDPLVISNPCFETYFSKVGEINSRIMSARHKNATVLAMSEGRIAYDTPFPKADIATIGHHMGGHS